MTPTAELCDYVLPATSFLEMENLATGFIHRRQGKLHMQYRPAVVAPLAERRSDTWMIFEFAKRLGLATIFGKATSRRLRARACADRHLISATQGVARWH